MKKHTIIVVNNNSAMLAAMARVVRSDGNEVETFSSSTAAMEFVQRTAAPDLIIVDLHVRDPDGWRFCELLRSPHCRHTNATSIMITSAVVLDRDLADAARFLGANAYLLLPCDNAVLSRKIQLLQNPDGVPRMGHVALVVDEDERARHTLAITLKRHEYGVVEAETAAQGIDLLRSDRPDVVLMDHLLPDKNGLEILPEIRRAQSDWDFVLIVITAKQDTKLATAYMQKGVDAFVEKPFSPDYLLELIYRAERVHGLRRTEQLLIERTASLASAESRFRDLFEHAPLGYHVLDANGKILSMNATELSWLGYEADEVVGRKTIFDLQTDSSAERGKAMFMEIKKKRHLDDAELDFLRKDGSVMPVALQSVFENDTSGDFTACRTIVRNISVQKQLEARLRHSERMESLGTMSLGIAHNFNNLLTPILINAADLLDGFPEESEEHDMIQDIVDAARRGSSLVKRLVALGRSPGKSKECIDLATLVTETVAILRKTMDRSVDIRTDLSSGLDPILGSTAEIQHVLLNLAHNARDSMPDGGVLTIGLQACEFSEGDAVLPAGKQSGRYVVLSVADTGVGMSEEVQKNIFDPFFTTKGLSSGTGLGLSTSYTTVRDHGGFLRINTECGRGSEFKVFLPVCEPPKGAPEIQDMVGDGMKKRDKVQPRNEGILIIDDEKDMLRSACHCLRHDGYAVAEAQTGIEGLDIVRKSMLHPQGPSSKDALPQRINLVILDLIMPQLSGEQVLEQLLDISPDLPVIVMSGCADAKRAKALLGKGARAFLSKPFEKEALLRAARSALDSAHGASL